MEIHPWELSPDEAARWQARLRQRLVLSWDERAIATVGGVDASIQEEAARAAIVVLRFPGLEPLEGVTADAPLVFPYIPGLLAFREGPAILAAWEKLTTRPDLLLFDGQGIAHSRGIGIASQMGLWLERPTVGVAKSRLYGRHAEPGNAAGDHAPLFDERDRQRVIGAVVRTRPNVTPLWVSPGHLIDVDHAIEFVLSCTAGYRLPEPTRWAHKVAGGEKLPVDTGRQARLFS
jgi:deoxyribonuclease V